MGSVQAFGVYQDYYTRVYLNEFTPSQISWIGSVQLFCIFFLGLPAGRLFDKGYFKHMFLSGSIIYIFSYFMLSLAKPQHYYQVFLSQGVGVGISMGLLYLPSLSVCFKYFIRRRAVALGLAGVGASVGGISQTIGLNYLFNGKVGFAGSIRLFGFIFIALLVISNIIMWMLPVITTKGEPGGSTEADASRASFMSLATDFPFVIGIFGLCLSLWGVYFPFFFTQLFAILHNISSDLAFYSIPILNLSGTVGRIVPGYFADTYGPVNVIIPVTLLCGGLIFTMITATSVGGLITFTILYGFFLGAFSSVAQATSSSYMDRNSNDYGLRIGFTLTAESFFLLVANPVAGVVLHSPRYNWVNAICVSGAFISLGALFIIVSRQLLVRNKGTWRV